jgi:hypothetical protein
LRLLCHQLQAAFAASLTWCGVQHAQLSVSASTPLAAVCAEIRNPAYLLLYTGWLQNFRTADLELRKYDFGTACNVTKWKPG